MDENAESQGNTDRTSYLLGQIRALRAANSLLIDIALDPVPIKREELNNRLAELSPLFEDLVSEYGELVANEMFSEGFLHALSGLSHYILEVC